MAKRKRLIPAPTTSVNPADAVETRPSRGLAGLGARAAPIADVAGNSAAQAALEEIAGEMADARREGRLVTRVPLQAIDETHLVRDRAHVDETEMESLMGSLRSRGQQNPLEVVDLGRGAYGLISGWRRLLALRRLHKEAVGESGGETAGAGTALCLVRAPRSASDAYVAMVEENEIRAGLSFYERARIAARAAEQGAYPTARHAVKGLFANATASRRSKIVSFLGLYEALDDVLRFPGAISEKLGLALIRELQAHPLLVNSLRPDLEQAGAQTAQQELAVIEAALADLRPRTKAQMNRILDAAGIPEDKRGGTQPKLVKTTPGTAVTVEYHKGRIVLSGKGVDESFREELEMWLLTGHGLGGSG